MISARAIALLAAGLAIAGCSDSPTDGEGDPVGRVSFQYSSSSAALNGSFSVEGAPPRTPFALPEPAHARAFHDGSGFLVRGARPRGGVTERIYLLIPRRDTDTYVITPGCTALPTCPYVDFSPVIPVGGTPREHLCILSTGTVKLTRVSRRRITGEFSGSGHCRALRTEGAEPIAFSGGTFSVAVTDDL